MRPSRVSATALFLSLSVGLCRTATAAEATGGPAATSAAAPAGPAGYPPATPPPAGYPATASPPAGYPPPYSGPYPGPTYPTPPGYPALVPGRLAPPQGDQGNGLPYVTLQTNNSRARLQVFKYRWIDVCVSPCKLNLPPVGPYRVGGGTAMSSESFDLPNRPGPVLIDAHVGSKIKHWVGIGLTIGGAVAGGSGALIYAAGSNAHSDVYGNSTLRDTYHVEGVVYMVTGAAMLITGLILWGSSGTSVDVN